MRVRPTWKVTQIGKRLIASVMCLSMLITLAPHVHAVSEKDSTGTQTGDIQSGELTITQKQSDAVMESLFGSEFTAVESSDGSYTYQLTQEGSDLLLEEMLGDTALSDDTAGEAINALPDGYVDNSNEALYDLLEELSMQPSTLAAAGSADKKVDLFFVLDSTGSMSSSITAVKENVAEFARYMGEKGITLRIGLIDYKDITADGNDSTVVHEVNFSPWLSVSDFITELTKVSVAGGGDGPETPIDALGLLTDGAMGWSSDAYKFAMLVTDADYKTNNQHGIADMDDMIQKLQAADIQVSVVTNSNYMDDYGTLAGYTGGIQADLHSDFGPLLQEYADAVIGSTQPMKDYTIVVKEQTTGLPVSGATVSWRGGSTTTDVNGIAVIQARSNVIEDLHIECAGYLDRTVDTFTIGESGSGEVTLTVDEAAEDAAGGVPVVTENMFKNPGSASDTLRGPSITILGKTFDLLELDIKIDLGLFDKISISHDPDQKTYSVMIGQEYEGTDPKNDPYWKDDYKKYKSLVQTFSDKSAKDIYNEFRTLRKNNKAKADLIFPVDVCVGGYADFSYATGTLQPTEGGIVIGVSTKDVTLVDAPFPPAPYVFFRLTFSADAKGNFNVVTIDSTGKAAFGVTMKNLELKPALTGTLNLGVPKLASVGGGVKGSLGIELDGLPPEKLKEILTVDANFDLVFSLKLFGFEFGEEWSWGSLQLYPSTSRAMTLAEIGMNDFQPILPQDRPSLMAAALPAHDLEFTASVYEDTAPQIVPYENGYMMVWVDTDPGRAVTDHMALYYSIYNGAGWSEPKIITDDDTGDFAPSMAVKSDGTPVVVWQNAKNGSASTTLEDRLANMEICVATFNGTQWTTKTIANTEGIAPLAVQAVSNGTSASVYWLENSANSPFFTEGTTSIYKVNADAELVAVDDSLASNVEGLSAFAAGSIGGQESYAYVCNDSLYVNGTEYHIGSDCHSLQVVDDKLYWSDSDGFKSFNGSSIVLEGSSIPSGFTVLSRGDNRIILMNQLAEDGGSILYASISTGSEWSDFAEIKNYDSMILTTSAVLNEDGSILWATGQVLDPTLESEAGQLVVDTYTPAVNVEVATDAYVSLLQAAPSETVQVMVDLTNKGLKAAEDLSAKIGETSYDLTIIDETDPAKDILLTTLDTGESVTAQVAYTLPADLSRGHTIAVDIYSGATELGTATATVYGAADLAVSDAAAVRNPDGTATVTAIVTNQGSIPAATPTVTLSQESIAIAEPLDGTDVVTLEDLDANASQSVSFTVDAAALAAANPYDYKRFTISASTATTEWLVADNQDSVLLAPLSVESITASEDTLTLNTGSTYTLGYTVAPAGAATNVSFMSSDASIVTVTSDGVITPLKAGTATITVLAVESGKSDVVAVTVVGDSGVGVDDVQVFPNNIKLKVGESATLSATISPENASNKAVTWRTSTSDILKLTADGSTVTVTALAEGEGKVTVVTTDGNYTDTATILVSGTATEPDPDPEGGSTGGGGGGSTSSYRIDVDVTAGGDVIVRPTSASKDTRVTITVDPDSGYKVDKLIVTDDNGNELTVTQRSENTYTFQMPRSRVTVEAAFTLITEGVQPLPFSDVVEESWYYDAVRYVYENGLMSGTSTTMFGPDIATSRGMIVTMLYRLAGSPAITEEARFSDVEAGQWYAGAVSWAASNGVVSGYSDDLFGPNDPITREQMAAILYRYAQLNGYDVTDRADLSRFTDVDQVSDWAQTAMQWANAEGFITGNSATTLNPLGFATRAEVATILTNFCENIVR